MVARRRASATSARPSRTSDVAAKSILAPVSSRMHARYARSRACRLQQRCVTVSGCRRRGDDDGRAHD
jgi:hypothetical protein